MQNSIWKLTALAGVIGIGFLIALQTQNGLNADKDAALSETQVSTEETAQTEAANVANNATGLFQSEPIPGSTEVSNPTRSP